MWAERGTRRGVARGARIALKGPRRRISLPSRRNVIGQPDRLACIVRAAGCPAVVSSLGPLIPGVVRR